MSTRGVMFSERIIGQSERMYKGEVYVEKGRKSLDSALIIEGLNSECYLIVRDTSAREQFTISYQSNFLKNHQTF